MIPSILSFPLQNMIAVNYKCLFNADSTNNSVSLIIGHSDFNSRITDIPLESLDSDGVLDALKQYVTLSCACTSFEGNRGTCGYYIKRCPLIITPSIPAVFHT